MRSDSPISFATSHPALSESQLEAFIELRELCEKNDRYWPKSKIERRTSPDINDDVTLLRYLRARNYDPQAAFKQYSSTASWRKTLQLNDTYDNVQVSSFEATRRLFPQWTGRRSKDGIPIFVYVVSEVRPEDLVATCARDPDLSSIFLPAEHATHFVYPLCSRMHPGGVVSSAFNIIDLSGVGVRLFWNMRKLLQKSSTMATAHYPETVEKIFVIGAPSFFPTIWGFVTKWFDPATTSKIFILSPADVKSTLTKYVDIEDLPKRYGGNQQWEFGMHPFPDEETKRLVGGMGTKWVEGPMRYVPSEESDVILAVGAEGGRERREVLATLNAQEKSSERIEAR